MSGGWRRPGESGQVVFLALVGFIPFMLLALVVLDTGVLLEDRVGRQNAADAAALAALHQQAVALNAISVSNVTMTYLLGEAVAEKGFLRGLKRIVDGYRLQIEPLRLECSSPEPIDLRCPLLPLYETEYIEYQGLLEVAKQALPKLCNAPGEDGMTSGGSLFVMMKDLAAFEESVAELKALDADAARAVAKENRAEGAIIAADSEDLPIKRGHFSDLGDPAENGSPGPDPADRAGMQRGYRPLLKLDWNVGPMKEPVDRFRTIIKSAVLARFPPMLPQVRTYDASVHEVLREWISAGSGTSSGGLPEPYLLAGVGSPDAIPGFREGRQAICFAWGRRVDFLAETMLGGGDKIRYAYAQAEIYNGTSWDLFTQDWRVRMVPASLLERGHPPARFVGEPPPGVRLEPVFELPKEFVEWIGAH